MKKLLLIFVILPILSISCNIGKTHYESELEPYSFVDPAFVNTKFKNFCVLVDMDNPISSISLEKEIVQELKYYSIKGVEFKTLFPPTREWHEDSIQTKLKANNIDAFLKISSDLQLAYTKHTESWSQERYYNTSKYEIIDVKSKKTAFIGYLKYNTDHSQYYIMKNMNTRISRDVCKTLAESGFYDKDKYKRPRKNR